MPKYAVRETKEIAALLHGLADHEHARKKDHDVRVYGAESGLGRDLACEEND
ncbi:Uncharacterised protein [uncultured archaeon]|nr:Uncharacterised protein [uncultured archaeon]